MWGGKGIPSKAWRGSQFGPPPLGFLVQLYTPVAKQLVHKRAERRLLQIQPPLLVRLRALEVKAIACVVCLFLFHCKTSFETRVHLAPLCFGSTKSAAILSPRLFLPCSHHLCGGDVRPTRARTHRGKGSRASKKSVQGCLKPPRTGSDSSVRASPGYCSRFSSGALLTSPQLARCLWWHKHIRKQILRDGLGQHEEQGMKDFYGLKMVENPSRIRMRLLIWPKQTTNYIVGL